MPLLLILLILFISPSLYATCPYLGWDQSVRLKKINDGDTLTLESGQLVRFIGINTPEINHGDVAKSEPYAYQAKALLAKYLRPGDKLYLIFDKTKHDKYGRLLAYVYSKTGRDLAFMQLKSGYGKQWVIGRNDKFWRCFQDAEQQARKRKKALWKNFKPLSAGKLQESDQGYIYVIGRITGIENSKNGLQLVIDRLLIISISAYNYAVFQKSAIEFLLHDKLLITGKLMFFTKQA